MEPKAINRVVYRLVGVNGLGKVDLIYVGQTSNFERRMEEHRTKLRLAIVSDKNAQRWVGEKYRRLKKHFRSGRFYFEKIDEGCWTWEEVLVRETEFIIENRRKLGKRRVLNILESPRDGMMPNGPLVRDPKTGELRISVMQGLVPGDEAILGADGSAKREIVEVVAKRSGPDRGLETWIFRRTGKGWTVGSMPEEIGMRIYRGPLLKIYRRSGKELCLDPVRRGSRASGVVSAGDEELACLPLPPTPQPEAAIFRRPKDEAQSQRDRALGAAQKNRQMERTARLKNQKRSVVGPLVGELPMLRGSNTRYEVTPERRQKKAKKVEARQAAS